MNPLLDTNTREKETLYNIRLTLEGLLTSSSLLEQEEKFISGKGGKHVVVSLGGL